MAKPKGSHKKHRQKKLASSPSPFSPYILTFFLFLLLFGVVIATSFASSSHLKTASSFQPTIVNTTSAPPPLPSATPTLPPVQADSNTIISHGSRDKKQVALTFDADMNPEMKKMLKEGKVKSWYNKAIIDTLNRNHTKATIFFTGMWVEEYPEETKELAANPLIEFANHSYSHPGFDGKCYGLPPVKEEDKDEEVEKAQRIIKDVTNITPRFFRFPGGCYSQNDITLVHKHGLVPIQWDVVGGDAFTKYSQHISDTILSQAQNGSIIVLHINGGPNAPQTNEVLSFVITVLKRRGYEFVTLSEMLGQ